MRLFKRKGSKVYQIAIDQKTKRSLGVTDLKEAEKLLAEYEQKALDKTLLILSQKDRLKISELSKMYVTDPDREELAQSTLTSDKLSLRLLRECLGDIPIRLIDKEAIKRFKKVSKKRVKLVSVNTYLRPIKAALRWAEGEGYLKKVPQIKQFKIGVKLPKYIDLKDVKKLLKYAKKNKPEMFRVMNFALYTGLRVAEVSRVRYEHITKDGLLKVIGKGKKQRLIPLLPQALKERQDIGPIFPWSHKDTYSEYFKEIAVACKINTTFHCLRHTAATMMLSSGIPIETVQEILGHTDLKTTQIYAKVLIEDTKKQMKKLDYGL